MLKINDLEQFSEAFKQENSEIKKILLLVDDEDYTKFVKAENHEKTEAILITVLPSANLVYTDTDNFKFVNHLHFFIIQKMDAKSSYKAYVDVFKFTQPLIKKLFDFIKLKTDDFEECMFKDFDLKRASFDPVTDKARTYGYSMSIPLKTPN